MRTADAWLQKLSLCGNPKRIDKRKDKSYAKRTYNRNNNFKNSIYRNGYLGNWRRHLVGRK